MARRDVATADSTWLNSENRAPQCGELDRLDLGELAQCGSRAEAGPLGGLRAAERERDVGLRDHLDRHSVLIAPDRWPWQRPIPDLFRLAGQLAVRQPTHPALPQEELISRLRRCLLVAAVPHIPSRLQMPPLP